MLRDGFLLVTLAAILCAGSSLGAELLDKQTGTGISNSQRIEVQVEELQPFSRVAYIPAGSDLSSIRFENARTVNLPTKISYTTDADYCAELSLFREPGGSVECPYRETESRAKAYEVTYSFRGQPLAGDEYGGRYFTFHVYFRQDELLPDLRAALATGQLRPDQATGYFAVKTSRESAQRTVIDEASSSFCTTFLHDGLWTRHDRYCQDRINYKTVAVPSDYITVRVDPVRTD